MASPTSCDDKAIVAVVILPGGAADERLRDRHPRDPPTYFSDTSTVSIWQDKNEVSNFRAKCVEIYNSSGEIMAYSIGIGDLTVTVATVDGCRLRFTFKDVLVVPHTMYNVICGKAVYNYSKITFSHYDCSIVLNGKQVIFAEKIHGLYETKFSVLTPDTRPVKRSFYEMESASYKPPETIEEAKRQFDAGFWMQAAKQVYRDLMKEEVWDLVRLPPNKNLVDCKWVFTNAKDNDQYMSRHRAQLMAIGSTQKEHVDFEQTYAPTLSLESVRLIFALSAQLDLRVDRLDVKDAYLYGELTEEVYMRQPPGFEVKGKEHFVCKLHRSIYGLKQAARCWGSKIKDILLNFGFTACSHDPCLYVLDTKGSCTLIGVYVDVLLMASDNPKRRAEFLNYLVRRVEIAKYQEVTEFLGMQVVTLADGNGYCLYQPKYTHKILKVFETEYVDISRGHIFPGTRLDRLTGPPTDATRYRTVVGQLSWLARSTRPDICFAVSALSQYSKSPRSAHWKAVEKLLRYLAHTVDCGIVFRKKRGGLTLKGYSSAAFASDGNGKSRIGYVVMVGDSPVDWSSKSITAKTTCTIDATLFALQEVTSNGLSMRGLLSEIGLPRTLQVYQDNDWPKLLRQKSYVTATNRLRTAEQFMTDKTRDGNVRVLFINTYNTMADTFIKFLPIETLESHRLLLNLKTVT